MHQRSGYTNSSKTEKYFAAKFQYQLDPAYLRDGLSQLKQKFPKKNCFVLFSQNMLSANSIAIHFLLLFQDFFSLIRSVPHDLLMTYVREVISSWTFHKPPRFHLFRWSTSLFLRLPPFPWRSVNYQNFPVSSATLGKRNPTKLALK